MKTLSLSLSLLLTLSIAFLFPAELPAQIKYRIKQKVYLSNGWVLNGDTSLVQGKQSLKIITPDHQEFIFPIQEVDSIKNAKFRSPQKNEMGYSNIVQVGFLLHNPDPSPGADPTRIANYYTLSLQYTGSFTSASGPSLGIGSGVNLYSRGYVLPVYVDIRGDLGRGLIRPHLYTQIGTTIPLYGRDQLSDLWGNRIFEDFKAKGGLLLEIGAGLKFMAKENYAWFLSGGWRIQELTETYKLWESRYKDKHSFKRISLQLGCIF